MIVEIKKRPYPDNDVPAGESNDPVVVGTITTDDMSLEEAQRAARIVASQCFPEECVTVYNFARFDRFIREVWSRAYSIGLEDGKSSRDYL
jgi:hypothetical protein